MNWEGTTWKTGSRNGREGFGGDYLARQSLAQYEGDEEMLGVLGRIEDNFFLNTSKKRTKAYTDILSALSR